MNKKYMDFVPVDKAKQSARKTVANPAVKTKPVEKPVEKVEEEVVIEEILAVATPRRKEPNYGVIEDYRPTFVGAKVEKRPLGQAPAKPAVKEPAAKPVAKPATKAPDGGMLKVPKTRFVNTEKIEKRPLSKNVYKKKVAAPKEEPSAPVTIISKPDRDSHIGVIVTIILTIVLGAAAGTVAFLLLPK